MLGESPADQARWSPRRTSPVDLSVQQTEWPPSLQECTPVCLGLHYTTINISGFSHGRRAALRRPKALAATKSPSPRRGDARRSLQLHIRGLPRRIRDWGLYKAVDERVVNMSTVLPLVRSGNPARCLTHRYSPATRAHTRMSALACALPSEFGEAPGIVWHRQCSHLSLLPARRQAYTEAGKSQ